jgi:predicted aminopeptidase
VMSRKRRVTPKRFVRIFHSRTRCGLVAIVARMLVLCLCSSVTACSPFYVMRAAYEQGKILAGRRDIQSVIDDKETSEADRQKLSLVLAAREFAGEIGLNPGNSFTSYSDVGKDSLAWVVVGARRDSFSLHTWWFPIVGRVPYKGFFDKADADEAAKDLEAEGYEAWVRDTDAFSTLGWFDDPVLSTTLKGSQTRIANTVLHESVHSTVWIKNNVAFNESLAHFVGTQAAVEFFSKRAAACVGAQKECEVAKALEKAVSLERDRVFELADAITKLYTALNSLYKSTELTSEQKIERRGDVFAETIGPLRAKYPGLTILKSVHNAEIMQLMLYNTSLDSFRALFNSSAENWSVFLGEIRSIAAAVDGDQSVDPFVLLQSKSKGRL